MKLKHTKKMNWNNGLLIFVCSTGCFSNQSFKSNCTESPKQDCICTMDYKPVCGCNQKLMPMLVVQSVRELCIINQVNVISSPIKNVHGVKDPPLIKSEFNLRINTESKKNSSMYKRIGYT